MSIGEAIRTALIQADPRLSRFNPLRRILSFDDFDDGMNGWCELIGNHDGNLDNVAPGKLDLRPPQLSNATFFDIGSHTALGGTYALKLATRPTPWSLAACVKRLTSMHLGLVQFEMYFTFKAEAAVRAGGREAAWDGNVDLSEAQFGDFTISNDALGGPDNRRFLLSLRYVNTDDAGRLVRTWMYKTSVHPTTKMQISGRADGPFDLHAMSPDDWRPVPGGAYRFCYNEIPTKFNWHYLRWSFDTQACRHVELQVNDLTLDLRALPVPLYDHPYEGLHGLLNFVLDVRTMTATRNFLFVDSALISADW